MKFFAHVLLETVFLLQGAWDIFQAIEVFLLVSDIGNYAVQYLANNFMIVLLRIAIWQSRFKRMDVLLIAMAVSWTILKFVSGYMDINVEVCAVARDQTYVMLAYHSLGFVCGVFALIVDLWHTNTVTATVWTNTLSFGNKQIDTKSGITKKTTENSGISVQFTESSIEDVAEFVRRQLRSKQSVGVKMVKKIASKNLNMQPMRFHI